MAGAKSVAVVVFLAVACGGASAQSKGVSFQTGKSYLGLNLGRSHFDTDCGTTTLVCDRADRSAKLSVGTAISEHFGVEASLVDLGSIPRLGGTTRAQGLDLSLVGRARLLPSLSVFGKVGPTYGRTDTSVMGAPSGTPAGTEHGLGLAWGGGVSYDITSHVSATLEVDSHDLRFAGGTRDPVRSTSLGLQFRY